jgi:hypothetical protein
LRVVNALRLESKAVGVSGGTGRYLYRQIGGRRTNITKYAIAVDWAYVPGAANSFSELLGIPREIIDKNESFVPNIQQLYTLWLLDYNNKYSGSCLSAIQYGMIEYINV